MADLQRTVESYLRRLGRDHVAMLGTADGPAPATSQDSAFLTESLRSDRKMTDGLLMSAVILLYGIFALAAALVWHYRDQPKAITVALGGGFLSLTVLVRWLRQLWIDKNFMDLILRAAEHLSPDELAKLVSTYYELMVRDGRNAHRGQPREGVI